MNAQFGGMDNDFDDREAFDKSFGFAGIQHKQTYYGGLRVGKKECDDGLLSIGKAFMDKVEKDPSFNSTDGGTYTGYGLFNPYVDPMVVDRTIRETPLVKLLPRMASNSKYYVFNYMSAKDGAKFYDENPSLANQKDSYNVGTLNMKYLYAVGSVTRPAQLSGSPIDPMQEKIRVATASLNEALENEIVNGNTTTDALGFQGLIQSITTNTTDNSDSRITLEQIRDDLNTSFEANGIIDLAVTDGNTHNYIKGLLMDYQRYVQEPSGIMDFGIPDAFVFDGVLVIRDRYMPTTAAARRIIYLDSRYVKLAVLQDYTYEEGARVNPSRKFWISWYGALLVNFEASCVMRYGLA